MNYEKKLAKEYDRILAQTFSKSFTRWKHTLQRARWRTLKAVYRQPWEGKPMTMTFRRPHPWTEVHIANCVMEIEEIEGVKF